MSERLGTRAAAGRRLFWVGLRPSWLPTVVLGAAVALGGCGNTAAGRVGSGATGPVPGGGASTLHVVVGEYQLRPDQAELSTGSVTIVVQNLGRLTHDLVIAAGNRWLGATKPIWPGQTAVLTLDLPPGTYSMFSALLSDQSVGAYGTITVTQ